MIYYGAQTMFFLCGIVFTLIMLYIVMAIVAFFMKRRLKKAMKAWKELKEEEDGKKICACGRNKH